MISGRMTGYKTLATEGALDRYPHLLRAPEFDPHFTLPDGILRSRRELDEANTVSILECISRCSSSSR